MSTKQFAYSILVVVIAAAGCGSSPVKKPKDGSMDVDGTAGGTGGGFVTGGSGGATGGTSGSGGATGGSSGTGGAVVEPPAQDAGPDANTDASTDVSASDAGDGGGDALGDGGDAGTVTCSVPAICTLADKRCTATGVQTCELVAGCPGWGAEVACGMNRTCTGTGAASACICNAPPAACTAAGTFCSSATVRSTCEMVNGCLALSATTKTCGASQTCTGNLPSGDCVCNAAPTGCTAAGTFCPTPTSVGTCTMDADSCLSKSGNDTVCMNGQVCIKSGNTASCQCPTTVGTTLGTACTTVGQTVCDGTNVLTCTMNATSGCKSWVLTTECAANNAGLTCGVKGGPAACECPAVTDGNYYADPVAGSDVTTSAPFATGAKFPAACRFKTLAKASNVAVNSGNKIIAITATTPGVFTEPAEISVAAGVTLTTDDASPNPANYRIDHTGSAAGAVVVLGNGSAISGFTIRNGNTVGNPANPVVGLRCTVGTVTVNKVTLEGTSTNGMNIMATGVQIGTAPINTCTGTFTGLSVIGFGTNIFVSTSAGTAPVINSSNVYNTALGTIGFELQAGTVTTNDLVIQPQPGVVSAGYGVVVRPGSPTIAANYVGNSTSIQNTANDAVWLDSVGGMVAPQATLTSVFILNPTSAGASGIVVESGTLNLTGTGTITSPDQYGIDSQGGAIVGTGLTIANATDDGVHVTGGSVTLHKTIVRNSGNRNVWMDNGAVLLDDGSALTGAVNAGVEFAGAAGDSLTIGSTTGDLVDISTNAGHGVSLTGTGSSTSTVIVRRSKIHDNSMSGVSIALSANGNAITVEDAEINANHINGVVVTGAPSTTATNSVVLDNLDIHHHTGATANAGKGIWLNGNDAASNNITATINQCLVHDNRDVGVQIDEDMPAGHVTTTRAAVTSTDVYGNNATGVSTVGGIYFATSSTLTAFQANKIHSNGKDQLAFTNEPTAGGNWDINAPGACSTAADAQQNRIYCYTLPGAIGLRTTAPSAAGAYTVDAGGVTWSNTTVMAGREYVQGANTTITTTGPCTPAMACP